MTTIMSKILNHIPNKIFKPKFYGENGIITQLIMKQVKFNKCNGIGLLLVQENTYDRVHSDYPTAFMAHFGFPIQLINCMRSLFFETIGLVTIGSIYD
ncbi:unnamed protein product [Cunninghamella echinulata]